MPSITLALLLLSSFSTSAHASHLITIDFRVNNLKQLKRFWVNTGFSPLQNDASFFDSPDLHTNLEIIGSLPNNGLKNVRIHWLLDLLTVKNFENNLPIFEFEKLDRFLDKLIFVYSLRPTIEFMTSFKYGDLSEKYWENFSYQILSHYIDKYGSSNVVKWKLETWNEPDLAGYNKLNFTLSEYQDYIRGIKAGLNGVGNKYLMNKKKLKLRGPAGLFKDYNRHKFCWSVLEDCNKNISTCPIDIITFHRKGNGNDANEIVEGGLDLIKEFLVKFPKLSSLKYSNTEADPIKRWSEPRDFQADTRYASILVETIFQHWSAIFDGRMRKLESISHDNGFMNFVPNTFTQRTLLARLQINNTSPKYVQFIRKPVFTALGLMSNLGQFSSNVESIDNISYIVSVNNDTKRFYSCIILTSHVNNKLYINKTKSYEFEIKNLPKSDDLIYFVEFIDNKRTNPSRLYEMMNKPVYPDINAIQMMRNAEGPIYFEQPSKVVDGRIFFNAQLMEPFVMAVRICSKNVEAAKRIHNVRIRRVNTQEIILFWIDSFYRERCIKSYEIFFRYHDDGAFHQIEAKYIPFLYHQFKHTIPGCFKVRSRDFHNRVSQFSNEKCTDVD